MIGPARVFPLHAAQMAAVEPEDTVWLSASAGTGKTQVLSSRVLRLLLRPHVSPSQILCLTFTKAGATEMAARINGTLAEWVRLPDVALAQRLDAIGADIGPDTLARARTLFTAVLDCPGGGLRIDTIHAFAQWLLGAFPSEAGLAPGTRAMEDRDRILLSRQVLADLLVKAEQEPFADPQLIAALEDLSLRVGPDAAESWLMRCAGARAAWFGPGSWQEPLRDRVMALLGLPADADAGLVAAQCADDSFDVASLRRCMEANAAWQAKTGQEAAAVIGAWLALDAQTRTDALDSLAGAFLTQKGTLRSGKSQEKFDPDYMHYAERVAESIAKVRELRTLLALADRLVPALRLGRAFAFAWEAAKQREGYMDFDDQIRLAADLLRNSAQADWIRYKLDRRFDHILVDEAQDTNAAQWAIVDALTDDFFNGQGQRGDALRTLFVVGDYKQAIFGFQGTSPENFQQAKERFRDVMLGAANNAAELRGRHRPKTLQDLGLKRSFRTAQTVLDFVDATIAHLGYATLGLPEAPERHVGEERPGHVVMWRPVGNIGADDDGEDEPEEGGDNWLSRPDRQMADRIARQIRHWLDTGFPLPKEGRNAHAGDIMVLVRKRRELAALIVARLHTAGVPVAGVDRLRLGAPLAVRDLVAALRFAVQPLDDLNLASLLVSPLLGWSQEQLLQHGYRDKGVRLWAHLRQVSHPDVALAMEQLTALLRLADYEPPQALLHWLLVGPWQGRRRLVARLGFEANDPIDELLNAASAYVAGNTPSLAGFIAWFDAGEGELKREAGNSAGLVRVMTAHGSKGLEAPIVILADAAGNPDARRGASLDLPDEGAPDRRIPLPSLRSDERVGRIAEEHQRALAEEAKEHWRLLYVAMTRAREALFIGGALGLREKEPAENSWYARLQQVFGTQDWADDTIWGGRLEHGDTLQLGGATETPVVEAVAPTAALPDWLARAPAAEPRPPKPLAPSSLGEDVGASAPLPPGLAAAAAMRGVLIHKLLERLPEVTSASREEAGSRWLARNAANLSEAERSAFLVDALGVLGHPDWRDLFAAGSLAEVPIAATVAGQVVAGTIDRLLIGPEIIRIVDFKTARRVPESLAQVPAAILRQMAAYAAALEAIYPGRTIEAAVLYTSAPRLIEIPRDTLAAHKLALATTE